MRQQSAVKMFVMCCHVKCSILIRWIWRLKILSRTAVTPYACARSARVARCAPLRQRAAACCRTPRMSRGRRGHSVTFTALYAAQQNGCCSRVRAAHAIIEYEQRIEAARATSRAATTARRAQRYAQQMPRRHAPTRGATPPPARATPRVALRAASPNTRSKAKRLNNVARAARLPYARSARVAAAAYRYVCARTRK